MKSFKDADGLIWDVVVNTGTAEAVTDAVGVNIFELYGDAAKEVFSNPILLVNVIYVLCRKQAEGRNISDVRFGELLVGDVIEDAATALLEAVSDFFPSGRRKIMQSMLKKSQAAATQMEAEALAKVEALDVASLLRSMK